MESKSKVSSSLVAAAIAVLMAVYFTTSVFAGCAKGPQPPCPPSSVGAGGDVATTNCLPLSRIMLAGNQFGDEDGCIGSTCSGTDPCCSGCLCIPVLGRNDGICIGICCILG